MLHNLLEHVALVLVELDSRHAEYVVLQAVGASTKTRLIMVSLDDYSTTILIMRPSILTRTMEPVHQGSGRKERTHARTGCCGTVSDCVAQGSSVRNSRAGRATGWHASIVAMAIAFCVGGRNLPLIL